MTVVNGLPARASCVHLVLDAPLAVLLESACALWPAGRRGQLAEDARLRAARVGFTSDIIFGPRGCQILLEDPTGNPVELFTPAAAR